MSTDSKSPALTTTSYAILGLLAVKAWSAYELATQMDRALGEFWPRARSKVYEEPKRLVAKGLATAEREMVGRRPRTVYAITADGRRALAEWIPQPGSERSVEIEELVRVFFAEHGTRDDLLRTLERIRSAEEHRAARHQSIPAEYLTGHGPYPGRLPWLILTGRLLDDLQLAIHRWATWATSIVETWPDDIADAPPDLATLRRIQRTTNTLATHAVRPRAQSQPPRPPRPGGRAAR